MTLKAPEGVQAILVAARTRQRFFVPKYVGAKGLGRDRGSVTPTGADWDEMAELITESYCLTAPKRLGGAASARAPAPPRSAHRVESR